MKKLILTAIISAFCLMGSAQSWIPLGNGIRPVSSNFINTQSTFYNGNLYVAEREYSSGNYLVNLYIWNGSSWSTAPSYISASFIGHATDIIGYQGDIYVTIGPKLLRFDGNSWMEITSVPANNLLRDLEISGNNLYVAGYYTATPQTNLVAAEFDGSNWTLLPPLGMGISQNLYGGRQVKEINGNIYVRTMQDSLSSITTNLFKYNSSTASWDYAFQYFDNPASTKQEISTVITDGQRIFAQGAGNSKTIMEIRNDSVVDIHTEGNYFFINDYVFFNNIFYLSGNFSGQQTSFATFDGNVLAPMLNAPSSFQFGQPISALAADGNLIYAAGNFTTFNGTTYNSVMATNGDISSVSGNVFVDLNSDCQHNSGEQKANAAIVTVNPGNLRFTTNVNGDFNVGLAPGNYTVAGINFTSPAHQNLSISTCGSTNFTAVTNQNTVHDIAVEFNSSDPDLLTQLSSFTAWRARYGFTVDYKLSVYNAGISNEQNITVDVVVPTGLQISSSNPAFTSQNNNTYSWNISALNSLDDFQAGFSIVIDTALVNMGDSLTFTSTVSTATGEVNTSNNIVNLVQEVVGAYDPNDKTASATQVEPGTDKLEYVIRFQNTGNDTAFTVTIRDTLSQDFILSDLKMISSSHNYDLQIKHNVVSWVFNNILLPDSNVDVSGSQGYVHFSIGIDPSLTEGTVIDNDAEIYFDYQHPVHTNHAQTTIVKNMSLVENFKNQLSLEVYPNPARDRVTVHNRTSELQNLKIYNTLGQMIKMLEISKEAKSEIQLDELNAGVYFIRTESETYRLVIAK